MNTCCVCLEEVDNIVYTCNTCKDGKVCGRCFETILEFHYDKSTCRCPCCRSFNKINSSVFFDTFERTYHLESGILSKCEITDELYNGFDIPKLGDVFTDYNGHYDSYYKVIDEGEEYIKCIEAKFTILNHVIMYEWFPVNEHSKVCAEYYYIEKDFFDFEIEYSYFGKEPKNICKNGVIFLRK